MKRLIVLTALLTLLVSLSGCSIVNGRRGAQPCGRPLVTNQRTPRLSLPWRRSPGNSCNTCGQDIAAEPICNSCGNTWGNASIRTAPIATESLYPPSATVYGEMPVFEGGVVEGPPMPTSGPEMRVLGG